MKIPVAKIGLLLLLIIVLPTIFFSAYEIGNMSRNEEMIDSIYVSQLESVLFSINQYADDQVSSWAWEIEYSINKSKELHESNIRDFLRFNAAIDFVFLADSTKVLKSFSKKSNTDSVSLQRQTSKVLIENNLEIRKLLKYVKSGYRKNRKFTN